MPELEGLDSELEIIKREKESAIAYMDHRIPYINENYELYRGHVLINRYTQRQTINVPLMKYAVNTFLKNLSETPALFFPNLDNDTQKEVYYNEYWKETSRRNNLKVKDALDKKACVLSGRSYKKINIEDGKVTIEIVPTEHMLVQRFTDPAEFHNTQFACQTQIFVPLRVLLANKDYNQEELAKLRMYFETDTGQLEAEKNVDSMYEKQQKLLDLGVTDALDPVLGETYVELNEAYRYEFSEDKDQDIIFKYIIAATDNGTFNLHKKELYKVIGDTADDFWCNHYPYEAWACDPESVDYHSDGIADIIRQINKVVNSYISQSVENRTLRNFNMHYYDSSDPNFIPQTYTPQPWGWYPLPGNPNEKLKLVEIPELTGSLEEIKFLLDLAEKSTATTATQTGQTSSNVTLGDVQLALANAQERVDVVDQYANESWRRFGVLYTKVLEAAADLLDEVRIYKKGRQTNKMYPKKILPKDWWTKSGYSVDIKIRSDKEKEDVNSLQKLNAAKQAMPENPALTRIYNRKLLEFADLTPDEVSEVEEAQKEAVQNPLMGQEMLGQPGQPQGQTLPAVPDIQGAGVPPMPNIQGQNA